MGEVADMRVLIVDDESVIADSLALIFRASGFEARSVYSGERALELAPVFEPDVLISDVVMRGVTGIEVAIYVREHFPTCRVLLFSGQAATSDLVQAADTKGYRFDILSKPVHPQVLLEYLQDCATRVEPRHATTGS
jgi:DNA-binding response OmpR family regulator